MLEDTMSSLPQSARTRSVLTPTHLLHTPESFVRTPLPGLTNGMAIVHACPALGAGFTWSTLELEAGGTFVSAVHQRVVYVLEGDAVLTLDAENYTEGAPQTHPLGMGSYAYLRTSEFATVKAHSAVRLVFIEKAYELLAGVELPASFIGYEPQVTATRLNGDPNLLVRALLPPNFAFDFAVNTMTYAPNAALSQVEVHYMEHGLLMLEGAGPYLLNDTVYPTEAGDFIWMAPYCPQWFQADATGSAKYLIYKNFHRAPAL
jgi:(S)-ureidoglycine aminohydrolase